MLWLKEASALLLNILNDKQQQLFNIITAILPQLNMPIFGLTEELIFPHPNFAEEDGLLAVGGDLSPQRIILAYQNGIFPWFSDYEPIMWWSPDPRFVLYPNQLKVSKSMKQIFRNGRFAVTFDTHFRAVIQACQQKARKGQYGTWITDEMLEAYCELHKYGIAHSVEVWNSETHTLAGGLYGLSLGTCFCGESMFSHESNASKTGFITLIHQLKEWDFRLIDCQIKTNHLQSLGASDIPRNQFLKILEQCLSEKHKTGKWKLELDIGQLFPRKG